MDVREAISVAKNYVRDVYQDEEVLNLGLEETEYDEALNRWLITLGFSRPWNSPRSASQAILEQINGVTPLRRAYKIITVSDNGEVLAMKSRQVANAEE